MRRLRPPLPPADADGWSGAERRSASQRVEAHIAEQMARLVEVLNLGQQYAAAQRDQLLQMTAAVTASVRREIATALRRVVEVRRGNVRAARCCPQIRSH